MAIYDTKIGIELTILVESKIITNSTKLHITRTIRVFLIADRILVLHRKLTEIYDLIKNLRVKLLCNKIYIQVKGKKNTKVVGVLPVNKRIANNNVEQN